MGSIFGRPYNGRPFVPRFPVTLPVTSPAVPARSTTERDFVVSPNFQRPSSSLLDSERTSISPPDLTWNKPSRWEKEKAANQRLNMTYADQISIKCPTFTRLVILFPLKLNRRVQSVDAECQNDYMKIRLRFNGSFSGIIYSTGEIKTLQASFKL